VGRALAWLEAKRPFDPVLVSVPGHPGGTAAYFRGGLHADTVQSFVLTRAGTGSRALRMVADQPWLAAPASISFDGQTATATIGIRASQLQAPGVYIGTVTLTDSDTLVGPVARLIVTVATPLPVQGTAEPLALTIPVNTPSRVMIPVQLGRPVIIQTRVDGEPNGLTVALHEPDGMPFRGGHAPALAAYDSSAFTIDGHDAVAGDYELVALGGDPGQALASVRIIPSPVVVTSATTRPGSVALAFRSAAAEAAPVRAALALLGGATTRLITGQKCTCHSRCPHGQPRWSWRPPATVPSGTASPTLASRCSMRMGGSWARSRSTIPSRGSRWRCLPRMDRWQPTWCCSPGSPTARVRTGRCRWPCAISRRHRCR
jgi:hypothetical protein